MSLYTYHESDATLADLLGSHDTIAAYGDYDTIVGGSGSHDLFAAIGRQSWIIGGSGDHQTLYGSEADDTIVAGTGGDTIAGSATVEIGLAGNDTIMGADSVFLAHADTHLKVSTTDGDTILHFTDSGQTIQFDQKGIAIHFGDGQTLKS